MSIDTPPAVDTHIPSQRIITQDTATRIRELQKILWAMLFTEKINPENRLSQVRTLVNQLGELIDGRVLLTCGRKCKKCHRCQRRYTPEEKETWVCPACGNDRRCRNNVKEPGQACKFHGGMSLHGASHPSYKRGFYSRYLPALESARYNRALQDKDYIKLDNEMALIRTRIVELTERLGTKESSPAWDEVRELHVDLVDAHQFNDTERLQSGLQRLGEILTQVADRAHTWEEIGDQVDRYARLAEKEQRRIATLETILTMDKLTMLATTIVKVLSVHITDRTLLNTIGQELDRLLTGGGVSSATISRSRELAEPISQP